jgi:uncharacterized protein YuzE
MTFTPRLRYSESADCAYVELDPERHSADTEELDDYRLIDHAEDGRVLGVEFVQASAGIDLDGVPEADTVRRLVLEAGLPLADPDAFGGYHYEPTADGRWEVVHDDTGVRVALADTALKAANLARDFAARDAGRKHAAG